jgi:hypothetical protein
LYVLFSKRNFSRRNLKWKTQNSGENPLTAVNVSLEQLLSSPEVAF